MCVKRQVLLARYYINRSANDFALIEIQFGLCRIFLLKYGERTANIVSTSGWIRSILISYKRLDCNLIYRKPNSLRFTESHTCANDDNRPTHNFFLFIIYLAYFPLYYNFFNEWVSTAGFALLVLLCIRSVSKDEKESLLGDGRNFLMSSKIAKRMVFALFIPPLALNMEFQFC